MPKMIYIDTEVDSVEAVGSPDRRMLEDTLVGWNLVRAMRSNAVAIVNQGQAAYKPGEVL
ncbi:hypothetical protein GW923_04630 [Candidatus Pacearchaeota archaeon]|nr:hypothetical protein [Candidatus Pacearchaeota archaeon]